MNDCNHLQRVCWILTEVVYLQRLLNIDRSGVLTAFVEYWPKWCTYSVCWILTEVVYLQGLLNIDRSGVLTAFVEYWPKWCTYSVCWILTEVVYLQRLLNIDRSGVLTAFVEYWPKWCTYSVCCCMAGATRSSCRLGSRSVYTIKPCTSLLCHFMHSHIVYRGLGIVLECAVCKKEKHRQVASL